MTPGYPFGPKERHIRRGNPNENPSPRTGASSCEPEGEAPLTSEACWGIATFIDDEGGFTSVAVALALLVSLCLVFAVAQVQWIAARSGDVQVVADACALSGARAVRAFSVVAQVSDACVLSLGLCATLLCGAGLITALVPGMGSAGLSLVDSGRSMFESRRRFATSAAQGLRALEKTLPALIATNAWATADAYGGRVAYRGTALAYPQESGSSYDLADDVDAADLADQAAQAADLSNKAARDKQERDEALERGWRADCLDDPSCLYSRARSLASLSAEKNPHFAHPDGWNFGVALSRARAYYQARLSQEAPTSSSPEEQVNSACRLAFFEYAAQATVQGTYQEHPDGTKTIDLPELPHDRASMQQTSLYTQARWPATQQGATRYIHGYASCPEAQGKAQTLAAVSEVDSGACASCPVCKMGPQALGRTASASTNISNGFEYYWRAIVEASKDFEEADTRYQQSQGELKELAESQSSLYEQVLAQLAVPRPKLCPPGAWGCVGVALSGRTQMPVGLTGGFAGEGELPAGCAIAGATLAPDPETAQNNVLSRFFDSLTQGEEGGVAGVVQGVTSLWGELLCGYGEAYGSVGETANKLFDGLEAVGAGGAAAWLKSKISGMVAALGFEPADMRLRKPVLCATQDIFDKDGSGEGARVRSVLQQLPAEGSAADLVQAFGHIVQDWIGEQEISLGTLEIPGLPFSVPIKVRLGDLWGGL